MSKVLTVATAFLCEHPLRLALTTAATAAATCLVIWIASSYDALHRTYDEYANLALGRYQLAIAPIDTTGEHWIPDDVVRDLRADKALAIVDPMWAKRLSLDELPPFLPTADNSTALKSTNQVINETPGGRSPEAGPMVPRNDVPGAERRPLIPELLFVATDAAEPPHEMADGAWIDPHSGQPTVVIRADVAEERQLAVGSKLAVKLGSGVRQLEVVGMVNAPSLPGAGPQGIPILTPSSADAYISHSLAEELFESPRGISLIGIALNDEADLTKFRFGWAPKLSGYSIPVQFQEAFEIEEALDQASAAQNVRLQSYAATGIAMLVAGLVILSSLSMGVNERIRQYAVLRAVALTRGQVGWLIVLEGLSLGVVGLLAGLVASWLLLQIVGRLFAQVLYHGIEIGAWSLTLAAIAMIGGAAIASLVPAYRAMRVRPIDAMAPRPASEEDSRFIGPSMFIGLVLLLVNPVLTFVFPPQTESTVYSRMAVGFITMAMGFMLLAPLLVRAVDRWGSPVVSRLFRINPKLLASQLSSRIWRSVGAAVSLAFGLGLFLSIHVWGWTMLEAFIPGEWAPDALAAISPGLTAKQADALVQLEGIHTQRSSPIVVEQPRLLRDLTGSAERASITRQDNVIIVGLDPQIAMGGDDPLLNVQWVGGNRNEAIEHMRLSRACVVPDHFLRESNLKVGDSMELVPPENPDIPVAYTIVGAVNLHGWHWQTKLTGLRPRTHRAAALVLAGFDSVSKDFDLPLATHLWFEFDSSAPNMERLTQAMLASLNTDSDQSAGSEPMASVRIVTVESIRGHLRNIASRWLWVASQVPLLALVIAAVGVLNVLLASVRSRRWEFGVMRAVGISQSQLTRAILAEGVLISVVACVLSISFGILAGWCGCGLAQYISFFGGLHPSLVVPLVPIVVGVLFAIGLGLLCAVAPALVIGRARPLALLQQTADSL